MSTQLSFKVDEQTLRDASQFAQKQGKTIDVILTEYLEAIARIQRSGGFLPIIERMIGIAEPQVKYRESDPKWEYLKKKYLRTLKPSSS